MKLGKDMMDLAKHIVETKSGHFEPEKFEDHYEAALKELIEKKIKGIELEVPEARAPVTVINLLDALRRSIEQEKRPSAAAKKRRRRIEGQTEMLLPIPGKKGKKAAGKTTARPSAGRRKRDNLPSSVYAAEGSLSREPLQIGLSWCCRFTGGGRPGDLHYVSAVLFLNRLRADHHSEPRL